jgi:hypothetical protein
MYINFDEYGEMIDKYGRAHYNKSLLTFFIICAFIIQSGLFLWILGQNANGSANVSQAISSISGMQISTATELLLAIFIASYIFGYLMIAAYYFIIKIFIIVWVILINLFHFIWKKFWATKTGGRIQNKLELFKSKHPVFFDPLAVTFGLLILFGVLCIILIISTPSSKKENGLINKNIIYKIKQ